MSRRRRACGRRRGPTQPSARNASSGVDAGLRGHDGGRWYRRPELAAAEIGWWFGFGYFVPGPVLDRRGLPGRGGDVRRAAAFRGHCCFPPASRCSMRRPQGSPRALDGRRPRVLVLALALSAAEWLRGHVLTGFPWNVLGYALTYPLAADAERRRARHLRADAAAVLIFAAPAGAVERSARRHGRPARQGGRARRGRWCRSPRWRCWARCASGARRPQTTVPDIKIRIVQPSVPQREKWRPENQRAHLLRSPGAVAPPARPARPTISPASRT